MDGICKKTKPIKANRRPLAGNPKHEALNSKRRHITEHNLKKQSQFTKVRVGVSIYTKGYYEDFLRFWATKNKANFFKVHVAHTGSCFILPVWSKYP